MFVIIDGTEEGQKQTTFVTFAENIKIDPSVSSKMSSEDQTKFKAPILLDVCWVGNGRRRIKRPDEKKHLTANMKSTSGTLIFLLLHFQNVFGKQFAQINNSGLSDMMYVINSLAEEIRTRLQRNGRFLKGKKTFSAAD